MNKHVIVFGVALLVCLVSYQLFDDGSTIGDALKVASVLTMLGYIFKILGYIFSSRRRRQRFYLGMVIGPMAFLTAWMAIDSWLNLNYEPPMAVFAFAFISFMFIVPLFMSSTSYGATPVIVVHEDD